MRALPFPLPLAGGGGGGGSTSPLPSLASSVGGAAGVLSAGTASTGKLAASKGGSDSSGSVSAGGRLWGNISGPLLPQPVSGSDNAMSTAASFRFMVAV